MLAMMAPLNATNDTTYDGMIIPEVGPYPLVYGVTWDSGEGTTLSSKFSTDLGATFHEFLHGFHLHHDFRNDWNFHGNIMGNGLRGMRGYTDPAKYTNDFTRQSYAFAAQSALSRFFNPNRPVPETAGPSVTAYPTGVVTMVGGKAKLDFSVSDPSGLGLALLIDGGGSYGGGVLAEQRLSGTSTNFTWLTPYYTTGGATLFELRVQDIYGNETSVNLNFSVPTVSNRCPFSNIKITPPMPAPGQTVYFESWGCSDPDDALASVTIEWDFNGDGTYDTAPVACTTTYSTNFATAGLYHVTVRLTDPHGATFVSSPAGMRVGMVTHYVRTNSPAPLAPYISWIHAATNIQDAINAAKSGDTVLVGPGVYRSGGRVASGAALTNRICITNAIVVRSDMGPGQTIIVGASDGGGYGPSAIRCAYVGSNAVLSGFTLTNGWTMASGDNYRDQSGGGALVMGGTVSNCTILNNAANIYGGGAGVYYGGAVLNSRLANNQAQRGGGVDLEYSGGASSLVKWCEIRNNNAVNYGGGVYCRGVGLVANSLVYSNTAGRYGGGVHLAYTSRVENCSIYANAATDTVTYGMGGGVMSEFSGGEVRSCTLADNTAGRQGGGICIKDGTGTVVNSIVYFNTATSGANWLTNNAAGSKVTYSCTTPTNGLPAGASCSTGDPRFVDAAAADYRLADNSPAIGTGQNSAWASNALDVAGNPRIVAGVIDMGACEADISMPAVTTAPVTNITTASAQCGGSLVLPGNPNASAKGLVWDTNSNPTVTNYLGKTAYSGSLGDFSDTMSSLTTGQTYYARAYASNSLGVSYGAERIFSPPMTGAGNASVFDGANDYVSIADCTALDLTNNYTLECWFKADGFGSLRGLIDKYQTANSYLLRLTGTDLDFDQMTTTNLNLQAGKWYHAAAINSNGTRRLYVNGELRALSGTPLPVQANSDPLRLGSDYGGRFFDGQMDEVRIWNVVRSVDEIRDAMHHGFSGSETGLVAYYRFDQTGGAGLPDVSGNGHDGTAVNGLAWTNSTFPCAVAITNYFNLRGAWSAKPTTLNSDRISLSNAVLTGVDFAIFGHDNATDGQQNTSDTPSNTDWRVERIWQVELAGAVSGNVRFDTTGLADVGDGSRLCVLADADGLFTNATVVNGSFSNPVFTASSQALGSNTFYTLAKLGAFPGVTTAPITNITATGAVSGGEVTNEGASAVIARGVCWNTNGTPTTSDNHTLDGSGLGVFISDLTNLLGGYTYYVRAYAVNGSGTGYGQQRSFTPIMTPPGNALDFDGANDYVSVADCAAIDLTTNYTLECWFKPDVVSGLRGLVSKYHTAGANGYFLRLNGANLEFDGTSVSGLTLQSGRWYHAAAINSNGTRRLYLNGVEQALSGAPLTVNANSGPLCIGTDFLADNNRFFNGQIDEVRVWSRVRTPDDIRDAMHHGVTGTETGLVAYYRCDHISGTALADFTGNGRDGTLMNGPLWTNGTFPCATTITNRLNLRGAWLGQNNSLTCSILSVTSTVVAGTDFRVFGHDGGALTSTVLDKPAVCGWRLNRAWQMEGTGALTGGVVFDCAGITNLMQNTSRLTLLADADGVFSNATVVAGSYNSGAQVLTISGQSLSNGFFYTLAEGDWPVVTTAPIANVISNSAQCGGNVTIAGASSVTARGCVWNTNGSPTVESHEGMTSDGSGPGSFASQLTGLTAARIYYVRAYAVNSQGTSYGVERTFTSAMIPPGNALVFDGANDCVSLPPALATSVGGTEAITIEYWFKGSQLQSPVRFQDGGGFIVAGWGATGPKHIISTDGDTANGLSVGAESTVENGLWHHLAMTWQRNTTNGFKSYLDGILVAQRNSASNALPSLSSATPYLGCQSGSSEFLAGCLDEVRIWSVVRSQDEIRDQMHKELNGAETGLVAYYRFNQLAGTTAFDGATNGYNGTLVNGPVWTSSTMPCAVVIADRFQVRGAWAAKTNSLASGRLALTNGVVTGTVFAVFGHDNATESQNASDKPAVADWRLNRVWRVEQNGTVPADLQFDTTGFSGPFALLVDADGVFSDSAQVSGSTDNGMFTAPDVSLTNGFYYTLGRINAPLLATAPISNVLWTTAMCGGNVTNQGGSTVTARGCVWNRSGNPTVENHEGLTTDGVGVGVFSSSLTGLVAESTYSVRAYAVNAQGTAYGAERTLTTLRSLAQVTTAPVSNITYYAAQCGGNVTNEGQSAVTAAGVCWNTTGSPTIANSHTTDRSGLGAFSSTLTGLVERQTYYVRAYASNSQGIAYGDERSFTAPMIVPGNCLDFDGINQKVASFGDIGPIPTNDVTVEAWVQLDDVTRDGKIVSRTSGLTGYEGYILGTQNGMLYPEAWDTAGTRYTFQAGVVIAGRWTHLAIVYQRNNALIGYVNGVEVGRTNVANLALRVHSQNGVDIGVGPGSFANYTDGRIDEVRVWCVARTEEQIRDDMHHALTGSESGLSACYNFDQASGSTLPDLTSNGSTYAYLNNMYDGNWWRSGWPCAHIIGGWNNLRGVWIDRTNSLGSSIMTFAPPSVTGTTFAIIGNDGGPLTKNTSDTPTSMYWRLDRAWQPESGGVTGGVVRFDCAPISSLIADPSLLRLLVDDDGAFTNASVLTGTYASNIFSVAGQTFATGIFYTVGEVISLAAVNTSPASNIAPFSATSGGQVTSEGAGSVTARGVCWNTTGNPTTNDSRTTDGSGLGTFTSSLTNLQPSTSYYVRAYAVNVSGTAYGDTLAFTTLTAFAQITTAPVTNITRNSAQCGGNVTNEGGYAVTARGVCWNTSGSPTTNDAHTADGSGLGAFVSQLTGLAGAQTYYVRAYAVNAAGVAYGNEQPFATLIAPPGNALDFNNSSMATGSGLPTNFANRMTLECWVYHDELTNRTSRYVTMEPEIAVIRHDVGNAGRLHTYFKLNGSLRGLLVDNVLVTGRWYHVAGVWDGTNINLYLNGLLLTNANWRFRVCEGILYGLGRDLSVPRAGRSAMVGA